MNKKVLLLQFRDDVSTEHEVACFIQKSGLSEGVFKVVNAILDDVDQLPERLLKGVGCVVLGGSGQYDLSKRQKPIVVALEKTKNLLDYVIDNDFPTLGVCFGHQLLIEHLGGKVLPVEEMAETGTFDIMLTQEGEKDKLFGELPHRFAVSFGHKESVVDLPAGFVLLASSEKCPIQAVRYEENIYCVQFHPELGVDDIVYRYSLYLGYTKGNSLVNLRKNLCETPYSASFLKNFLNLSLN